VDWGSYEVSVDAGWLFVVLGERFSPCQSSSFSSILFLLSPLYLPSIPFFIVEIISPTITSVKGFRS